MILVLRADHLQIKGDGLILRETSFCMTEKELKSVFKMLARAGEAIVEVYASNHFAEEIKSDNSPVTRADRASSKILNTEINRLFPGIPVLDEEHVIPPYEVRKNWARYFLVDPLDGTKEFIKQNGEFCINLSLMEGTRPAEGWIYQPLAQKGWYCKKGQGIFEFDERGIVQKIEPVSETPEVIRIVASRSFFKSREAEILEKIKKRYPVRVVHCGSSKKQVQMVLGNADMYLKAGPCSEWDTAPGQLMVEEFGGAVLLHENFEPMRYNKPALGNPHFFMLNKKLNTPEFIGFLKQIV